MTTIYEDDWNASLIDEADLFERLEIGDRGLVCDFGKGRQGVVYMTQDGGFVKITRSAREAALAASLLGRPRPGFPRIDDVARFELGGVCLFSIYREGTDDICDGEDPALDTVMRHAWGDLALIWPPQHHSADVQHLRELSPDMFGEFYKLLGRLQDLADFEGVEIHDLHVDNIGVTESGELVVRDFGQHNLPQHEVQELVSRIADMPEPKTSCALR